MFGRPVVPPAETAKKHKLFKTLIRLFFIVKPGVVYILENLFFYVLKNSKEWKTQ